MSELKVGGFVTAIDPCLMDEDDHGRGVYGLVVGKKYRVNKVGDIFTSEEFRIKSEVHEEHWFELDSDYFEETLPKDYLQEACDLLEDVIGDHACNYLPKQLGDRVTEFIEKHSKKV